jgi:hypothetical protein
MHGAFQSIFRHWLQNLQPMIGCRVPISGDERQFDGSRFSITLIRSDCAVGQQEPVALSLRDHETNLVDQKLAGLADVVDLAGALEEVEGNLDGFIEQERRCVVEPG